MCCQPTKGSTGHDECTFDGTESPCKQPMYRLFAMIAPGLISTFLPDGGTPNPTAVLHKQECQPEGFNSRRSKENPISTYPHLAKHLTICSITTVFPTQSIAKSTPAPPVTFINSATTSATSLEFIQVVAPTSLANANLSCAISIPMTCSTPRNFAAMRALSPILSRST